MKKRTINTLIIIAVSLIGAGILFIAGMIIAFTAWQSDSVGNLSVYYNKVTRSCFAGAFKWDGNQDNMVFSVPDEYNGISVKSLGGDYGRAPVMFYVQVPKEMHPKVTSSTFSAELAENIDENTVTYTFTVKLGKNIKRVGDGFAYDQYYMDENGMVLYTVRVNFECSPENGWIYSKDGKLYNKITDSLIE